MTITLHNPSHNPASCSCPACRAATTPAGAANIANWNTYATARTAVACDPVECALCGAYDDPSAMEIYAGRPICRDCRQDLADEADRFNAQLLDDMMLAGA